MRPFGIWAFLGIKEVVLMALVTLALYGRAGLKSRYLHYLRPWSDAPRRGPAGVRPGPVAAQVQDPASERRNDRLFWFLAIVAATAVAAWIVTRTLIVAGSGASHPG